MVRRTPKGPIGALVFACAVLLEVAHGFAPSAPGNGGAFRSATVSVKPSLISLSMREQTVSSRRDALRAAGGMAAAILAGAPLAVSAAPTSLSTIQSPLQDRLSPGHWFGQFLGVNCHQETWAFESSPEDVSAALVEVLEELDEETKARLLIPNFDIVEKTADRVHVRTWTKIEWLDALDVSFVETEEGCLAKASFYATGFLPTSFPGAPILNVALAPLPFASPAPSSAQYPSEFRGGMLQKYRIKQVQAMLAEKLDEPVVLSPRAICNVGDYATSNFLSCWSLLLP